MLAVQLKNYLSSVRDDANILVYVKTTDEVRQLIMSDLDTTGFGHVVIDAEYNVLPKVTRIEREGGEK